jgi:putative ABC transport system permease protein
MAEALGLAMVATVLGLLIGQLMILVTAQMLALQGSILLAAFSWPVELWLIPFMAIVIASLAACVPAFSVYRMNVLQVLQKRS